MKPETNEKDKNKRRFLIGASSVVGGSIFGTLAWSFLDSFNPSERAKAIGAPVEFDLSKLAPGQLATVTWRGKPVWILRRTEETLKNLASMDKVVLDSESETSIQPAYTKNRLRSYVGHEHIFVAISTCTHLGCIPQYRDRPGDIEESWKGGFYCPCHGSKFDLAGRVYPNVPAPANLEIPPYAYLSEDKIVIGLGPDEIKGGVV